MRYKTIMLRIPGPTGQPDRKRLNRRAAKHGDAQRLTGRKQHPAD